MHQCQKMANGKTWMLCVACEGRLHHPNCTARFNKSKDCCEARHKMLHDKGHTVGICDSSFEMYNTSNPSWAT